MNVAAIMAYLLASGVCGSLSFQGPNGKALEVIVCPRAYETAEAPAPQRRAEQQD